MLYRYFVLQLPRSCTWGPIFWVNKLPPGWQLNKLINIWAVYVSNKLPNTPPLLTIILPWHKDSRNPHLAQAPDVDHHLLIGLNGALELFR